MTDLEFRNEDDDAINLFKFSRGVHFEGVSLSVADHEPSENYYNAIIAHLTDEQAKQLKEWL